MNTENFQTLYNKTLIITLAQVFTIILFVSVVWLVDPYQAVMPSDFEIVLWVFIVLLAVSVLFLRRIFFSWERLKAKFVSEGIDGLVLDLHRKTVILSVVAEAVTILGVIIAFLSGDKFSAVRAAAISLILFFLIFPRKSLWEKIISSASKF